MTQARHVSFAFMMVLAQRRHAERLAALQARSPVPAPRSEAGAGEVPGRSPGRSPGKSPGVSSGSSRLLAFLYPP